MKPAKTAAALGGIRRSGDWWRCGCPVHGMQDAALALRGGERGLIVKCFAGRTRSEILADHDSNGCGEQVAHRAAARWLAEDRRVRIAAMPPRENKPDLIVQYGDLPATARELRNLFSACGYLFDRDMPVKLRQPASGGVVQAIRLTINNVVMEAHRLCQPVKLDKGEFLAITLPERVARMYLDMFGEWGLRPLAGISSAPLLAGDGTIRDAVGYDATTELWCCKTPPLYLPGQPTREDAVAALLLSREAFKTFPFADAPRRHDDALGVEVVDMARPPGQDESALLVGLLTAVCRPSLWLAPALLVVGPQISGAGTGKGLLVRAICSIAFGIRPRAFTAGHNVEELDKRIVAELVEAAPVLFLDNVNGAVLRSETLDSVLTERPARVRLLGKTRMVALNSTAFIAITGNGLSVSLDSVRRVVRSELDAGCEDPEARPFASGFLDKIESRRAELLSAALTIWRFGRQNAHDLLRGRPLGSFEEWCEWVRDPLLTLGCRDPAERVEVIKKRDPHRQRVAELFQTWNRHHGDKPVRVVELHEDVKEIADPQKRGRQYLASFFANLAGTRAADFVLTRQESVGTWSAATYSLIRATADNMGRSEHQTPMPPMPPMPYEPGTSELADEEETAWTG